MLSQNYPALEYIVLDDGSTDGTSALLKRYSKHVTAVRHPNQGEQRTVNRGWRMARGDILGTVNDDDLLLPGAVREAVQALRERPDVMVVYPDYTLVDANAELIGHVAGSGVRLSRDGPALVVPAGPGRFRPS